MRSYSFQIDPGARLGRRRARLDRAKAAREKTATRKRASAKPAMAEPSPPPARVRPRIESPKTHLRVVHSAYRGFRIACSELADGTWIASFARADGGLLAVNGLVQPVAVSRAYVGEALALAEAQLRIDALARALASATR